MTTTQTEQLTPYADPGRIFAGTAGHYARYRRPHPRLLTEMVADLAHHHTAAPRMTDLGCGPGLVSVELAARGVDMLAIDPSGEMVAAARARAAERQLDVDCRQGTAETIADQKGVRGVCGAVVADAFHWMDRPRVLGQLDQVVAAGGFIAVLCSHAAGAPRPWWHEVIAAVRARYVGRVPAAGAGQTYIVPAGDHQSVLKASAFARTAVVRAEHTVRYTVDDLVGVQFTFAYSSPALLGDRAKAFAADLKAALLAVEPSGVFEAEVTAALILGWRP
ncbi:class I SAM-dependent methyltransferase [Streptomyces sp. SM12]|uniref:class I SAM-dependent methyltransferase n=1 Tax=Streptomyces sp. SM12 TaxID=1071602 RepID=UPI000CD4FD94|nr:class I SAM-dependent methyltransferase [Streptomyces sp. SM12]